VSTVSSNAVVVDLEVDFHNEDETGYVWTWLSEARAPAMIGPERIVVVRDDHAIAPDVLCVSGPPGDCDNLLGMEIDFCAYLGDHAYDDMQGHGGTQCFRGAPLVTQYAAARKETRPRNWRSPQRDLERKAPIPGAHEVTLVDDCVVLDAGSQIAQANCGSPPRSWLS
jgi:hypothetical protein